MGPALPGDRTNLRGTWNLKLVPLLPVTLSLYRAIVG